jgi:putative ABC transport system permease protein
MLIGETIRLALQVLWMHKLRSVLTLLGIIIGVSSVIAVVSFVDGLNAYVAEKIFNLGADVFIASKAPVVITSMDAWLAAEKRRDLTMEHFGAVEEACTECQWVGATLRRRGEVVFGNNSLGDTFVAGWSYGMPYIYDMEVQWGRFYGPSEDDHSSMVAVVGWDVYEELIAPRDPIGQEIRVDGAVFEVIGVVEKRGSTLGQSRDSFVMIPLNTYDKRYGGRQSVRIWGKARAEGALPQAMEQARLALRIRRHLGPGQEDDFEVETNESFLAIWANISAAFFATIIAIASIALVVGGIGIMNMMLVSVSERTHEIGIRKSLGARRRDILLQFLLESSVLALLGGFLGVAFGLGLAFAVSALFGLPAAIKVWSIAGGLGVAISVGVFFGVYPANRGARLDPVVALRSE